MSYKSILIQFALISIISASASTPLKYVFEIVRHGARAPFLDDPRFTKTGPGELTPMGMR